MNENDIRTIVLTALGDVAPEASPEEIDPSASIQEQLDIDSMDFLDFVQAVAERTGVEVPERDYEHLQTVDAAVEYLAARTGAPSGASPS